MSHVNWHRPAALAIVCGLLLATTATAADRPPAGSEPVEVIGSRIRRTEPVEPAESAPVAPRLLSVPVQEAPALLPLHRSPEEIGMRAMPHYQPPPDPSREITVGKVTMKNRSLLAMSLDIRPKLETPPPNREVETPEDHFGEAFGHLPLLAYRGDVEPDAFVVPVNRPAGDFCYRPLYFQDANLERYGRSHGIVQPFVSGVRFFGTVPMVPYLMGAYPPCYCHDWNYPYPAGRSAPPVREMPPFSAKGAALEAGALLGLAWLIP